MRPSPANRHSTQVRQSMSPWPASPASSTSAKLDRTPTHRHATRHSSSPSVNPSLSAYDPLAQSPTQQAAQTAGLAAAVAGLFLRSQRCWNGGDRWSCPRQPAQPRFSPHAVSLRSDAGRSRRRRLAPADGSFAVAKPPSVSRTEFAFLCGPFALQTFPRPRSASSLLFTSRSSLKSTVPLGAKDWKLVPRFQDWRLVSDDDTASADGPVSVPVSAQLNVSAKTVDLDLTSAKLKAGTWKLAANWDWEPVTVGGSLVLHDFSTFKSAHLMPDSQDELTAGAGTLDLQLTGDDFEFTPRGRIRKSEGEAHSPNHSRCRSICPRNHLRDPKHR